MACDLGACSPIPNYFGSEHIIIFLLHSPVNSFRVGLSLGKEELLPSIEGGAGDVIGMSVEGAGIDRARPTQHFQELRIGGVPIDLDKGGNLASSVTRGNLEGISDSWILKVDAPPRPRVDIGLWSGRRWGALPVLVNPSHRFNGCFGVELDQGIDC
jgi:hypothetical protein